VRNVQHHRGRFVLIDEQRLTSLDRDGVGQIATVPFALTRFALPSDS
jgi:hypothetical protein